MAKKRKIRYFRATPIQAMLPDPRVKVIIAETRAKLKEVEEEDVQHSVPCRALGA
jgi:hypothetical protein